MAARKGTHLHHCHFILRYCFHDIRSCHPFPYNCFVARVEAARAEATARQTREGTL
jgi:hypothetical protein